MLKQFQFTGMILLSFVAYAQDPSTISPFDGRHWGIVLEHPGTERIVVQKQIRFNEGGGTPLYMDVYLPNDIQPNEKRSTIVLLNGVGDQPNGQPQKESPAYTSWSKLLAANGYVAITMSSEVNNVQPSIEAFFQFIDRDADKFHIERKKIGVHAFSANCREVVRYLTRENAYAGIKAAVLYYGEAPPGPYRSDLPTLFVVSELDNRNNNYATLWTEALNSKAPWTITLGPGMPHAFDVFSDTETSRRLIKSTISFWNDQLSDLPARTGPVSKEREIVASRYDRDASRFLALMKAWMTDHPDTKDTHALSAYGTALMESKSFAEAGRLFERSIKLEPGNKGNYLNMAMISYALGKSSEGEKYIAAYEKGDTRESFTYWYIANRLMGIGHYKDAISLYERALTFGSQPPFVYYNLAGAYAMTGNKEKAFENLAKSVDLKFGTKEKYENDANFTVLKSDARWMQTLEKIN